MPFYYLFCAISRRVTSGDRLEICCRQFLVSDLQTDDNNWPKNSTDEVRTWVLVCDVTCLVNLYSACLSYTQLVRRKQTVDIFWEFKDSKEEDGGVNDKMKSFYKLRVLSNFTGNIKRRMNDLTGHLT